MMQRRRRPERKGSSGSDRIREELRPERGKISLAQRVNVFYPQLGLGERKLEMKTCKGHDLSP